MTATDAEVYNFPSDPVALSDVMHRYQERILRFIEANRPFPPDTRSLHEQVCSNGWVRDRANDGVDGKWFVRPCKGCHPAGACECTACNPHKRKDYW